MVKIIAFNDGDREICERILQHLANFSLFSDSDKITAKTYENRVSISYWTAETQSVRDQTKFDIEIKDKTCDILGFWIKEADRLKGNGRNLYSTIKSFAREYGCRRIQTTPSGQGVEFWRTLGFNAPCEVGVEKTL